ncbi:hypothetical protein BKA62DRAFT_699743 [Auriculariales sp. MPI-PUGE-AT-0066]|nr:hypothetical protein BKA62DRAFT_699743 [Auriculariales sp. MPI-PUGE-AT-0066]
MDSTHESHGVTSSHWSSIDPARRKPLSRRRWLLAILATAVPLTCALFYYTISSPPRGQWDAVAISDTEVVAVAVQAAPRDPDAREPGAWQPRVPPYTQQDLAQSWNAEYELTERLPESVHTANDNEWAAASHARAVTLANWEWVPELNATLDERKWDWRAWTVRLLRSSGGLVIVGDSLHLQLFNNLRSHLPRNFRFSDENGYVRVYGFNDPDSVQPGLLRVYLPEDGSETAELLAAAGAPAARATRPVLSYIRDDLLLTPREIATLRDDVVRGFDDTGRPLLSAADAEQAWEEFKERFGEDYAFDTTKEGADGVTNVVSSGWEPRVEALLAPIDDWTGTEKTVVVVNTGAHWSGPCLPEIGEGRMKQLYARMVELNAPKLVNLATSARVIYRPTTPGHPLCDTATTPFASLDEAKAMLDKMDFVEDMAWGIFPQYNTIWRAVLEKMRDTQIGWMPIYSRSLLRPE